MLEVDNTQRTIFAAALILVVLGTTILPRIYAQGGTSAEVSVQGRIEFDKAVTFVRITYPQPTSRVELNISGIEDRLLASFITVGDNIVKGRVDDGRLVFDLPTQVKTVNITSVYGKAVNIVNNTVFYEIPVTLSPIGYAANTTGTVDFRSPYVKVDTPPFGEAERGTVKFNDTVPAGTTIVLRGNISADYVAVTRMERIDRTIILHKDRAEIADNITLVLLTNRPSRYLGLRIPRDFVVEKIKGPLGVYPERYWRTYSAGKYKLLSISLRAPPERQGQKTTITVYTTVNITGGTIDPFFGYGVYVAPDSYTVKVCIAGEATIDYAITSTEKIGEYKCYTLKNPGPVLIEKFYPPIRVSVIRVNEEEIPYPLIALVVATIVAVAGYAYYSEKRGGIERQKEKAVQRLEEDRVAEIERLLSRREELYRSLIERLRRMREKRVGTTKIINAIREAMRRDEAYVRRIKSLATSLGEPGNSFIKEMDRLTSVLRSRFDRLERIERAFRAGRMDKKEYKENIDKVEKDIEKTITEVVSLLKILEH